MTDVYCYAFVEDTPSAAVVQRLVKTRNASLDHAHRLLFYKGFPTVIKGYGAIKNKCEAFLKMASVGLHTCYAVKQK